jgi:hypothetical protein
MKLTTSRLTIGLITILGIFAVGSALTTADYCLKGEYFLGRVTSTIQTISRRYYVEGVGESQKWLIRGHITKFAVVGDHIVGYLSMKHVVEDDLVGLTEQYDKEGYFIVDTRDEKIVSGLSENEADHYIVETAGVKLGNIRLVSFYSPSMRLMCLLPEKWRPSYLR